MSSVSWSVKSSTGTSSSTTTVSSVALTSYSTALTGSTTDSSTQIATTAFVKNQAYATLAAPTFTGTVAAPTASTTDSSTTVATTAFVKNQAYATLASPSFTGSTNIGGTMLVVGATNALFGGAATFMSTSSFTGAATFDGALKTKGLYYEAITTVSGSASPFTLDYSAGGVYYISTASVPAANFAVIITNIPTDQTKTYTITLCFYQATNKFYASTARVSDTTGTTYILGTSSTYVAPLFSGGTPSITTAPCMIIQQFTIVSISSVRYCTSSVSASY
jgi:hypothetical protein